MYKITGLTSCVAGASRKVGRENQPKPHSDLPWRMSMMGLESGHVPQAPQGLRGARVTTGLDLGSRWFWRRALSSEDGRVYECAQHSPAGGVFMQECLKSPFHAECWCDIEIKQYIQLRLQKSVKGTT